jgi:hypothetical protein
MGDAKNCEYCGKPFTPRRSTRRFCGEHRKLAFKAKERREGQEQRMIEGRAGISLSFDGRDSGQPRNGFGIEEVIVVKKPRRDRVAYYGGHVLLSRGREWRGTQNG